MIFFAISKKVNVFEVQALTTFKFDSLSTNHLIIFKRSSIKENQIRRFD